MQEIIVYRSPLEAAMWRGMSDGSFFPIIAGIVVFFVAFLILQRAITMFCPSLRWKSRKSKWPGPDAISLTVSSVLAMLAVYKLWI